MSKTRRNSIFCPAHLTRGRELKLSFGAGIAANVRPPYTWARIETEIDREEPEFLRPPYTWARIET